MSNQAHIAVIVLNYFGYRDTLDCILSASADDRFHWFIVDNSSDSGERDRLKAAVSHLPRTRVLDARENLGFSKGVNLGLKEARQKAFTRFLVINNDTVLSPDAGDILAAAYERYPGSLIAPTIQWGARLNRGNYYHPLLGLIREAVGPMPRPMWQYYLTGCALAFDVKFLAVAGCLDERFFMYGEDVEYSARAARLGLPIRILDEVLVTHFGSKSSKPASLFYEYHINRSHLMLCCCLFDKPGHQWMSLIVKLPVLLCRALHRSIAHRTPCPLIGFFLSPISLRIRPQTTG